MSYFHEGRDHDEPYEDRVSRYLIEARNRTERNDTGNDSLVEADGDISIYWTGMKHGPA